MMRVGFEPTPFRTRYQGHQMTWSLVWRLRPLGHLTMEFQRRRSVVARCGRGCGLRELWEVRGTNNDRIRTTQDVS
jgi:hypothetical protein